MNEALSRGLAALQALLILLPLTLLAGFYLVFMAAVVWDTHDLMPWYGYAAALLALAASGCLLCLWHAVLAFAVGGRAGLARVDRRAFAALVAGACIAVLGAVCALPAPWLGLPEASTLYAVFAYGLPALLPALHVALERHRSTSPPPRHPKDGPWDS